MVNGMLWKIVEEQQRQQEKSHQGYLDHHSPREDKHHNREPSSDHCDSLPIGAPYSKTDHALKSKKILRKSKAANVGTSKATGIEKAMTTDILSDYTDFPSQPIDSFFTDIDFFALPDQPITGPSSTMHDPIPSNDTIEGDVAEATEEDGAYEGYKGADKAGADKAVESGKYAEDAVHISHNLWIAHMPQCQHSWTAHSRPVTIIMTQHISRPEFQAWQHPIMYKQLCGPIQ
ncbi:hypothetical protein F5141DRAFT_1060122 [Pisolithus sp. B1]|nr:hypothetical protein F5141DRAFT_1060122 [Pisolithus sp. B1]